MGATETNIKTIFAELTEQRKVNAELKDRIAMSENNVAILRAELQTTKQLIGHIAGRGMGSTVNTGA